MSLTRFLFSDKVRCFNQSERALYGNFTIKLVPCARALPQKELDPDSRFWKEFCQFPLCFPIPTFGTLNKMAGAKLTNEGTVSPWAFKSEQHPSMLPGTDNTLLLGPSLNRVWHRTRPPGLGLRVCRRGLILKYSSLQVSVHSDNLLHVMHASKMPLHGGRPETKDLTSW